MLFRNAVVNFHYINDPAWIEQVFLLLKKHYTLISVKQLESYYYEQKHLRNCCHITFDDGDESFYQVVYPIILKHKIPVSIYVSPKATKNGEDFWFQTKRLLDQNHLKEELLKYPGFAKHIDLLRQMSTNILCKSMPREEMAKILQSCLQDEHIDPKAPANMNVDQLLDIHRSGLVEIGAHTQNHPILANETNEIAEREISDSIHELSELLNEQVRYFAYPNGVPGLDFTEREMSYLKKSGVRIAFSTQTRSFSTSCNPLAIPRKGLTHGSEMFSLVKLALGRYWDGIKRIQNSNNEIDQRLKIQKLGLLTSKPD